MKPIVLVLAIAAAASPCERARAACVMPGSDMLVSQYLVGCCTLVSGPLGGVGPELRWVAASWEGPANGNLYVINCDGVKVAEAKSFGYVERLTAAPNIRGMPTVAVTYIPETGTNIKLRSVALVQYRAGQPRVLWKHAELDAAYLPANLGLSYEERTTWRFLGGYSRIETITIRTLIGKSRKTFSLPATRFCLRTSVLRYVPCR